MKTSKPNVTISRQDQMVLEAWGVVSVALGVIAVVVALDNSKPLFDSLVIGLIVYVVLVMGGFRIVVGMPIYQEIAYHVRWWSYERRVRWGLPVLYPPPQPPAPRGPAKVQHGADEAASVTEGQDHSPKMTFADAARWADADAHRWGDMASFKLFDKSIDALIDDYERTMGGIPADTLQVLIELGKEIEAAEVQKRGDSVTAAGVEVSNPQPTGSIEATGGAQRQTGELARLNIWILGITFLIVGWRLFAPVEVCVARGIRIMTTRWLPWNVASCPGPQGRIVDLAATGLQMAFILLAGIGLAWAIGGRRHLQRSALLGPAGPPRRHEKTEGRSGPLRSENLARKPLEISPEVARLANAGSLRLFNRSLSEEIAALESAGLPVTEDLINACIEAGAAEEIAAREASENRPKSS